MNGIETLFNLRGPVLLATHENPDGDAVGSVLGMSALLRRAGALPECWFPRFPRIFEYLREGHQIRTEIPPKTGYEAVVVLDCGSASQVAGGAENLPDAGIFWVIDHHRTRESFGRAQWVDPEASATGLLVAELAVASGIGLSAEIARPLWAALLTDTGSFRYGSTDARTLRMGAQLLEAGADPWEAAQAIYENYTLSRQRLLGLCLETLETHCGGQVASMYLTQQMAQRAGASMEESTGIINYARAVAGVEIAFFIREDERERGMWRVAFRSRGNYPVDTIAAQFAGGGHHNAAGCSVRGELPDVMARVAAAIERMVTAS